MSLKFFLVIAVVNTIQAHLWNNDFILKFLSCSEPEYSRGNEFLSRVPNGAAEESPNDETMFKWRQYKRRYFRFLNSKDGQFTLLDFLTSYEELRLHSYFFVHKVNFFVHEAG